ncbi:MAG TPA: zinc-dependent peptidase [Myxococcota bacterium]|nr:zinc-dependent peptidase [Myxococcota bacterium]HQP95927.1 zinc-dependent peptidase [Myxococcota bacterium]
MIGPIKRYLRWRLDRQPFPEEWRVYLTNYLACYRHMPEEWRGRYERMVRIFIAERHWIPAAGMQITDEVRVVIAGCAIRLVLRLDLSYYDRLTEIVVYPFVYRHNDEKGVAILGEAHHWGTVVLSWPAVVAGLTDPCDGHNTAIHEFAHVLDRDAGNFNGMPVLRSRRDYGPWASVLGYHYQRLVDGHPDETSVMRYYGATNPAEFFSVATEAFFETPGMMRTRLPDLYRELKRFYGGTPFDYGQCPRRF